MNTLYDVAIIGAGPAGLSAALNLKLHNKNIIWFGAKDLSDKVNKSESIANYPGFYRVSGQQLNEEFKKQIAAEGLELTEHMVTNITSMRGKFMLLADNVVYEAKTVLLATGTVSDKGFAGESEFLGRGVSYCATCDGFLYKGKKIAVYCGSKRYEHEVEYLAEIAEQVYLSCGYPDCEIHRENVQKLPARIQEISGQMRAQILTLADGSQMDVDGIFILRASIAPTSLISGLEMDGPHIVIDRQCRTNKPGVYAAGDCTGRPYQITTAVGEGNTAAHAILEELAQ